MAYLPREDCQLYYDLRGSGQPVLLIHGAGGYADLYGPLADELVATHRVVVYDRRGFGRSEHAPVRNLRAHLPDAVALIEQVCGGQATVLGWSAGGVLALHLAVEHPTLVQNLVLAEPALLMKAPRPSILWEVAKWQITRLRQGGERAAEVFYHWVSQYRTGGNAFDHYPMEWRKVMTRHYDALFAEVRPGSGATGERLSRRGLRGIVCPVETFVGGLSAPPFLPAAEYLKRLLPQSGLTVVPQASHMLPTDAPGVLAEAIRELSS